MDPTALVAALTAAGPFGLISAILLILYLRADKRNQELVDKVIELSTAMTASLKDITTAINAAIKVRAP